MVFSSISFLYVFLPAVIILHTVAPKKMKNTVLLISSLIFYFVGEQLLTLLMLLSAVVDYSCSLGIERFRTGKMLTRLFLGISLAFNIGILAYFKYADLFITSFNALTGVAVPLLRIALPIGISFYTFQTMSYTVDVYRGKVKAERNFIDFAAYVTIFPQLIAGPIVRYETVSAELRCRQVTLSAFAYGIRRFALGLAKKVIIANSLAEITKLYDGSDAHTVLFAWLAAVSVPLQIYFDFSGYSDMAIGLGKMLGFSFPENFDHPFASLSASEFWRRWHMTLGEWFRDYVYIPLGGNRNGAVRTIVNLLIVWLATGLWHGAAYNFIIWGLWYGLLIILEKFVYGRFISKSKLLSRVYFVIITVIGFEIFSASSVGDTFTRLGELVGVGTTAAYDSASLFYLKDYAVTVILSVVLSLPIASGIIKKVRESGKADTVYRIAASVAAVASLVVCTAYLIDGSYNPFLYFRF